MAGSMVSWNDYAGLQGGGGASLFEGGDWEGANGGIASQADVDALNKALTAGSDINNPGSSPGEGFPLRVESLDSTLYNVTYSQDQIKFWKMLYKDPAYNTVEEFNRLEAYGSGDSIWISEGDLPEEDDSTYSRQYTKIKFMGITRRVTHVASVIRAAHGDAVARETVNGTLHLLRQLERTLFTGDENMISIQFDGIETLMAKAFDDTLSDDGQYLGYEDSTNVIDLRGASLSEDFISDMAEQLTAEPNYGSPSDLWLPTGPMYPKARYDLPAPSNGKAGIKIDGIKTPFGDIALNPNIFIPDSTTPQADGVGRAGRRPGAPTLGTPTSPAYAGSNQTFFAAADAGSYYYKVVAGSRYGKSTPVTSAQIAVSAADQVQFTVTDVGPDTSYYEVFRSNKDGAASTCRSIMRVKRTATTQTIVDLNRFLPNCSKGYMLSQSNEVLKWKQLAPFTKIPLATIDTSVRWMQILYGALQLQKPRYCGMFINVGKLETGVNA
jgi:hypothetical protein